MIRICFTITCLFLSCVLYAQTLQPVNDAEKAGNNIWSHCLFLRDTLNMLTIGEVSSPAFDSRFVPASRHSSSFGFTSSVIWLKFSLRQQSHPLYLTLERVSVWDVRLYIPEEGGGYLEKQLGAKVPYQEKEIRSVFSIGEIPAGEGTITCYLRIQTNTSLFVPVYLDTVSTLLERLRQLDLFYGAYIGILLLVIIINLISFHLKRNTIYLWYLSYVSCLLIYLGLCNSGIGFAYLWPDSPLLNQYFVVPATLLGISSLMFSASFLNTSTQLPAFDKGIKVLMLLLGMVLLLSLSGLHLIITPYLFWFMLPAFLLQIIAGIESYRRGNRNARFYLAGWGIFLSFYLLFSLWLNGFTGDFFPGHKALYYGSVFEMLLWLSAISEKVRMSEKRELEQENRLRKLIARDFHDEIGNRAARLINYLSLLKIRNQIGQNEYELLNEHSQGLMGGTRDFVWSLDPKNDEIGNVVIHLKDFGEKLFAEKEIDFRFNSVLPGETLLPTGFSRQLVLIFKEAMTNVFRHSGARIVEFGIEMQQGIFVLFLRDNGKGIPETVLNNAEGGIDNMKYRAEKIGTKFQLESSEKGTEIKLLINLQQIT